MSDVAKCEVCGGEAKQKCGGCLNTFYCSKEHQTKAWKTHKQFCKPFKVCEDEILGRYLIATRHIKPGEIILKEPPLIHGPLQITIPVCLGCGKGLTKESSRPCSKCGWPVCSETCENSENHGPECYYTVRRGDKVSIKDFDLPHPSYQCVTVLRALYQQQFEPKVWEKLMKLESHCAERKGTSKYDNDRVSVAKFIRRFFHLDEQFGEEEILRVCGIIMVNGHEVPLSDPPHVAVYDYTSLFEHNCQANCSKTFTTKGETLVSAGVPIQKGDHLSICYTDPLWGTANRRHHLHATKFFWCNCTRCSDVTECGTYMNAIKCQKSNCKGYVLPATFLEKTEKSSSTPWSCNKCKKDVEDQTIQELLERIGKDLEAMEKGTSSACKKFLKKCEKLLPENHFYMVDVKLALQQIIGQENEGGLPEVSDDDVALKAKLCKELGDLVKTIHPGEKRLRGILLFELHAAIAEIAQRKGQKEMMNPQEFYVALLQAKEILQESMELLQHEPDVIQEGKIYKQARWNVENLNYILESIKHCAK